CRHRPGGQSDGDLAVECRGEELEHLPALRREVRRIELLLYFGQERLQFRGVQEAPAGSRLGYRFPQTPGLEEREVVVDLGRQQPAEAEDRIPRGAPPG